MPLKCKIKKKREHSNEFICSFFPPPSFRDSEEPDIPTISEYVSEYMCNLYNWQRIYRHRDSISINQCHSTEGDLATPGEMLVTARVGREDLLWASCEERP